MSSPAKFSPLSSPMEKPAQFSRQNAPSMSLPALPSTSSPCSPTAGAPLPSPTKSSSTDAFSSSPSPDTPTIYFAYGSNLSTTQMSRRCPTSKLYNPPLAILHDYEWFIASRGYASIREKEGSVVWGLLWVLDERCERMLDMCEGVDEECYYKEWVEVDLVWKGADGGSSDGDGELLKEGEHQRKERVNALVYIDCTDEDGVLGDAYASRLKRGVEESRELGLEIGDSFVWWTKQVMNAEAAEGHGKKKKKLALERESSGQVVKVAKLDKEERGGNTLGDRPEEGW